MLPPEEVQVWLKHLDTVATNRKLGAEKSAKTRRQKATKNRAELNEIDLYSCGVCNGTYQEETDEVENWIGCDHCEAWFHWACVDICEEPPTFLCYNCNT